MRHIRFLITAASAACLVSVLASCAGDRSGDNTSDTTEKVDNCSLEVEVDGPPERVYAAYQPAIEIAHALGISDRLVGTAYLDSQVLPEYRKAQSETKYVAKLPSRDALLAQNPDFVLSGYNDVFAESAADSSFGTRESLAKLGVQSWILSPLCPSEDGLTDAAIDPATVTVETLNADLLALGRIFDVEETAQKVIDDQTERIEAVTKAVEGQKRPTVAIAKLAEDGSVRAASGSDFGTQIINLAGGKNVFEDVTRVRNLDVEIEELIKRNPDVILTDKCCDADFSRADAADEVDAIMKNPALANLKAVKNEAVYPFLFADRAASVRSAYSIELVASILHPDQVDPPADDDLSN